MNIGAGETLAPFLFIGLVHMNNYEIMTHCNVQRSKWLEIFGMETLPVVEPFPHATFDTNGRLHHVFSLNIDSLQAGQVWRLAKRISTGDLFKAQRTIMEQGYLIDATNCELVTVEEAAPAFSLRKLIFGKVAHSF